MLSEAVCLGKSSLFQPPVSWVFKSQVHCFSKNENSLLEWNFFGLSMQRITSPICSTVLLCIPVLEAHLDLKRVQSKTRQAVSEPQSELSASVTGRSSPIFISYCREQHHIPLESALLAAGALQALQGAIRAQKLFYICCALSFNGPARFHSSIRLPYCNHSPAYHHVFYVIWAHPSTQRHGSKRWLQTIHVE